jgi:hypothetical protein
MYDFEEVPSNEVFQSQYAAGSTDFIDLPILPTFKFKVANIELDRVWVFNEFGSWRWNESPINSINFGRHFFESSPIGPSATPFAKLEMPRYYTLTRTIGGVTTDVTSIAEANNNRIPKSLIVPDATFRYRVRTIPRNLFFQYGNAAMTQLWNTELRGGLNPIKRGNGEPFTIGSAITGTEFVQYGGISAGYVFYDYYYDFSIVSTVTQGTAKPLRQTVSKAIGNIETQRIYDGRYYRNATSEEISDSEINSTLITTTTASNTIASLTSTIGQANNFQYKQLIFVSNYSRYYIVGSQIVDNIISSQSFDTSFSNVFYSNKSRYTIDPIIEDKLIELKTPDFKFTGGKNLLEVLTEIGALLDGIPRLNILDDGTYQITFDTIQALLKDNPNFEDDNSVYRTESSSDNYATGLVSTVENMLLDDETIKLNTVLTYPSSNSWIKIRNSDFNAPYIDLAGDTKGSLVVDDTNHSIYQITKLLVRGWNPQNLLETRDLTSFVLEKAVYDTLESSINEKGSRLYYQRGKNSIDNFLYKPDRDTIVGATGDKFTIQLVLEAADGRFRADGNLTVGQPIDMGVSGTVRSILDLEYQITYIPIINKNRFVIEQPNLNGLENEKNYNTYSQTERNISMYQLSQAADRILKRTGINTISKSYVIDDSERDLPSLGERVLFEGEYYYADTITYIYENNYISVNISYSMDYNKLNPFVGYNKNWRDYSILKDETVWKRMNLNNYCLVDINNASNIPTDSLFSTKTFTTFSNSVQFLFNNVTTPQKIEGAFLSFWSIDARHLRYDLNLGGGNIESREVTDKLAQVIPSYLNTSINFTLSAYDSFTFGRALKWMTDTQGAGWNLGITLPVSQPLLSNTYIGDQWFNESSNTLFTAVSNGTWAGATSVVLPVSRPAGVQANGTRYFDEATNKLYTYNRFAPTFNDRRYSQVYSRYGDNNSEAQVARIMFLGKNDIGTNTTNQITFDSTFFPEVRIPTTSNRYNFARIASVVSDIDETIFLDKDTLDGLQFTFHMHFVTKNKDVILKPGMVKYNKLINDIVYNTIDNPTPEPGKLIVVGIPNFERIRDELNYNYDASDVLNNTSWTISNDSNNRTVTMASKTFTPTKNYQGYALVFPGTKDIAMLVRKNMTANVSSNTGTITFKFANSK